MKYECYRCGYKTDKKTRLIEHLSRKFVCDPVKSTQTVEEIYTIYCKQWEEKKLSNCSSCGKNFDKKHSLYCHRRKCKEKNEKLTIENKDFLQNLVDMLMKENKELKKNLEEKTTVVINNVENLTAHIYVNALGNEDVSHLKTPVFQKKLEIVLKHYLACWDILPYFSQVLHYGNPNNKNIRACSIDNDMGQFFNGERWVTNSKKEIFQKVLLEEWTKMIDFIPDVLRNHKYFKTVEDKFGDSEKYRLYLRNQIEMIFTNEGNCDVFNNVSNYSSKSEIINEFLLES
jgi:molybdopterin converting factor small subunit